MKQIMHPTIMYILASLLFVVAVLLGWWFVWVPLLIWYSISKNGWYLVLAVILIDGYYGAFYAIPYQSLLAGLVVFATEYARPFILTS